MHTSSYLFTARLDFRALDVAANVRLAPRMLAERHRRAGWGLGVHSMASSARASSVGGRWLRPACHVSGVFDFHRAEEAIQLGVEATEKSLENIAEAIEALA